MQEINGKNVGSDLQTKAEEQEQKQGQQESKNEFKKEGSVGLIVYCMKLWILSLVKSLVIVTPVLVLLWIFFLPALVLRRDLVQEVKDLIYVKIQTVLVHLCSYGFTSVYGVSVFGFYFMKKALFFGYLPGFILSTFVDVFISRDLGILIYMIVVLLSSTLRIYRQKLPENPSQKLVEERERKFKILRPLAKMFAVIVVVFFFFRFIYPIFLNSNFQSKLLLRFVALPTVMTCCTSLQMHFLKPVQKKHMDFLIPMLWVTNGVLKMCERIFTNGMFNSGDYASLVATTFAAALIEIINHATYFHRHAITHTITKIIDKLRNGKNRSVQNIYVDPNDEPQLQNAKQKHESMDDYEWMLGLRKKLIIEDISIELMMIFTVTFLLYFAHPLIESEKTQMIPTFEICIIQLLIQLAFELLSDIFGIYWTITRHKIELQTSDVEIKNRWFWVWILLILFQSLFIFWFLLTF